MQWIYKWDGQTGVVSLDFVQEELTCKLFVHLLLLWLVTDEDDTGTYHEADGVALETRPQIQPALTLLELAK
ncbi:hypothetical protein TMatcc_005050 [Talaromyces marneffei ATCC 18224]